MNFGRSKIWAALLIVTLLQPVAPALAQARPQLRPGQEQVGPSDDLYTALQDAAALLAAGDGAAAEASLRVVDHPNFETLPDTVQFGAYFGLAGAISGQETDDAADADAYRYLKLAGEVAPALRSGIYWQYATLLAMRADQDADAVASFTELVSGYPQLVQAWKDASVFSMLAKSRGLHDPAANVALLEALWLMPFVPKDSSRSMESNWLALMANYLEKGDTEAASEIATTLTEATSLIAMTVDARFSAFRPADPLAAHKAALIAELAAAREAVDADPDSLSKVEAVAGILRDMVRGDEALAFLQASLDSMDNAAAGVRVFKDQEENLPWALNAQANLLLEAGRGEEAIEMQKRALEVASSYDPLEISQGLNLAEMLIWLERPEEALVVLNGVDMTESSAYAEMSAAEIRVCANDQLGNDEVAGNELAAMWKSAAEGYVPMRLALMCVGDKAGLKQLVKDRLADPEMRIGILIDLQVYPQSPLLPRYYRAMVELFDATMAEPDMKAAIGKHGTIETWPMGG